MIFQWITASTPAALLGLKCCSMRRKTSPMIASRCGPLRASRSCSSVTDEIVPATCSGSSDEQIGRAGCVLRLGHLLLLSHWIRAPEIAREITSRWISEVPSKIV